MKDSDTILFSFITDHLGRTPHQHLVATICMYVCMYVCMYFWMYVCVTPHRHLVATIRMYACMYACMYVCLGCTKKSQTMYTHAHMHTAKHMFSFTRCTHVVSSTHPCTCIHTYIHAYIHIYTRARTHRDRMNNTFTQTCTHTHMHTNVHTQAWIK
jgi:hypothetical protein